MKIALAFFGQLRYVDPAYVAWKQNVIDPLNITDIYVHTWDNQIDIEKTKQLFSPKKIMISDNDDIKKTDQWLENPQRKRNCVNSVYNVQSLFYSIYHSAKLVEDKYDAIILSRIDNIFFYPMKEFEIKDNEIISSTGMYNVLFDGRWQSMCDWFAIGNYESIQKFASIGINYRKLHDFFQIQFHPETLIGENTKMNKLFINPKFKVDTEHCLAINIRQLAPPEVKFLNDIPDALKKSITPFNYKPI